MTVIKSIGFTELRKFNSSALIIKIGWGDLSPLIRQALDPSFLSFKTPSGWEFLHYSQVLLLVYCQHFTMVLLVWPSYASPRRTNLTLGRGVTDAQLYKIIQPSSTCLTAFSCTMDSSVSMKKTQSKAASICCGCFFLS